MNISWLTSYSVVNCVNEYRINLFNPRPKIKINRSVKLIDSDDDGEVCFDSECQRVALRRARVAVVDLALCNDFDYFGTITFDSKKVGNDLNFPQLMKDRIADLFDNYKQTSAFDFKYILVPEYGAKKGRLHFHFIVSGLNKEDLFINEKSHLDWHLTSDRFGFTQITKIKGTRLDRVRVAKYCAKYLSKDSIKICNHRYFASKGLKRPERSVIEHDDEALLVSEWLEAQGFSAYCDLLYAKCYSLPAHVFEDLQLYLRSCRKSRRPYLITLPDSVVSPWDWNFNVSQMHIREFVS